MQWRTAHFLGAAAIGIPTGTTKKIVARNIHGNHLLRCARVVQGLALRRPTPSFSRREMETRTPQINSIVEIVYDASIMAWPASYDINRRPDLRRCSEVLGRSFSGALEQTLNFAVQFGYPLEASRPAVGALLLRVASLVFGLLALIDLVRRDDGFAHLGTCYFSLCRQETFLTSSSVAFLPSWLWKPAFHSPVELLSSFCTANRRPALAAPYQPTATSH